MEEKSKRSRAACAPCRQTKQRCDGPSRIPCRRCELYNLHCEYKAPTTVFVPKAARPQPQQAVASTSGSTSSSTTIPVGRNVSTGNSDALAEQLKEISSRLKSIESALEQVSLTPKVAPLAPSIHSPSHPSPSNDSTASSSRAVDPVASTSKPHTINSNPVSVIIEAILSIEQSAPVAGEAIEVDDWLNPRGETPVGSSNVGMFGGVKPDVILRGIMSLEEAEASFQIFHSKLSPWVMFFDLNDYSAADMKERSPLLFHVILLSTSYYLMRGSERGTSVYHSLTSLVNELVTPFLVSPQPRQLNTDLVRALTLLLLWKPIQYASLYDQGITDPISAEQASKLNGSASNSLGSTIVRIMSTISLPEIANTFSAAYNSSLPINPQILADLRLWYWLCAINTHAAVSIGLVTSVDLTEALQTTRLFASLRLQPYDIRLAATLELYGIVSRPTGVRQGFTTDDLQSLNRQLDEFERHWEHPLRQAQSIDNLSYTVIAVFASFVRLVVNLSVYTRWKFERKQSLDGGGNGRPELSLEDWTHLEKAVAAAERMIFSLSTESNTDVGTKEVRWPIKLDGLPRPSLHLDPAIVESHKCAMDTVACVVYIYALIFIVKLANTGLIRCDLNSMINEYRSGVSLNGPRQLIAGAKLGRLVELGSKFLDAIAPTDSHPAKKHAKMLRTLLAAGTAGQMIAIDPSEMREKTRPFPLPSPHLSARSSFESTTPSHYSLIALHSPTSSQGEHGEALHSILSNITPNFMGKLIGNWVSPDLESGLEGMTVDWDSLEKSMLRMNENYEGEDSIHRSEFF